VRTLRSPQKLEAVRQSFIRSPRLSARRHSVGLQISDRSVRGILNKDLNFHPYKMVVVQESSDRDMANHSTVAESLFGTLSDDIIIFATDEAHFHLSGCINKQNFRYWAGENPRQLRQRPLHIARVTAWCGVANFGP
jgi:hypothetical protein